MGSMETVYTTRKVIATVVNSDDVENVIAKMKKALSGEKAVIMISAVDDLVML